MDTALLKRWLPGGILLLLLLASLYLMGVATESSARFGHFYLYFFLFNVLALLGLTALIFRHFLRLWRQYRSRAPGARLTFRLVTLFSLLTLAPVAIVYAFSLQFLQRSIDSWFDVRIERALEDALELGRAALDTRLREALRTTQTMAQALVEIPDEAANISLHQLRSQSGAYELTLMNDRGRIIAFASADPLHILPIRPEGTGLLQLRQGRAYVGLGPASDGNLYIRAVVPVEHLLAKNEPRVLQALYPFPQRLHALAEHVQAAYGQYQELSYLRKPLKFSFTLSLSLVLLLSALAAILAGIEAARRMVTPIGELAKGTRAVAEGRYDTQLPVTGQDDLAFLVQSFNDMTRKLARARDQAQRYQQQLERSRAHLEAILTHISSGVWMVDTQKVLRTTNKAAGHILKTPLDRFVGRPIEDISQAHPHLMPLVETLRSHLQGDQAWHAELTLMNPKRQVLICRGSPLFNPADVPAGHVIAFDDITALIQAQRDAAWGEVARRLAHEIKNPLTPIQLSAERLRHKYLKRMSGKDADLMDRLTHTIIQQVEAMKEMVNAFSEYARAPRMQRQPMNLNEVIQEVLELYRGGSLALHVQLDPALPPMEGDPARLRQVLHNLIKNAQEAMEGRQDAALWLTTRCAPDERCWFAELIVEDNGPGIPEGMLEQLFEPYVTTKPKGTGLGLAIVKRIVEEHGGIIWAEHRTGGGARIVIRFPFDIPPRQHTETETKEAFNES